MSARPGFVVDHRVPADGGVSPNAYVARIGVQVRCNWPPRASVEVVREALLEGYEKALAELDFSRKEWERGAPVHRYDWTEAETPNRTTEEPR